MAEANILRARMSGKIDGTSTTIAAFGLMPEVCIAYLLIAILGLQIIYSVRNKAERAGYMFLIGLVPALYVGRPSLIITMISFASGCCVAAYARPPLWVWRALGNKDRLVLGAFFSTAVASILLSILPLKEILRDGLYYLSAGSALLLFIAGDQFPASKLSGWLCLLLAGAILAVDLGRESPLGGICAFPILVRVIMEALRERQRLREAAGIKDEHVILEEKDLPVS